jgi:hypothetical protein
MAVWKTEMHQLREKLEAMTSVLERSLREVQVDRCYSLLRSLSYQGTFSILFLFF